ncbi:restriction endonuclease subunit S [Pseudomonas sp. CFSAN084952]|uniref:restriction endonuclease subunit S n=1 Tax=Pseudomonas TaxID=286 RepID=UPI00129984CE|nr:restriction endonuclease subunit S [Pseudomonas sp. CFSAN084952]QGF95576.1 restriction endonuclease subunit S [Pseudomonas sp. CFSAN084952]
MTALLTDNLPLLTGAPNGIQKLRELILELAVRGKLVPHDASDEPASELLKRIAAEKTQLVAEGKLKKQKALADVSESEKPFALPVGWTWEFWDTIALKIGDIDHKMPNTTSEGVPFVSPRDFYPGNVINFDGAKRVSVEDFERLSAKIKAERGDLIYPRYGTIGENILVDVERDFLVSYSCAVIKVAHGFIDPIYQFYVSMSGCIRKQAKAAENRTTQANVGIKSIQQYLFPIPPLAEQHRIVAKVDELMALCDHLETQQADAESAHARLVQALLDSLSQASDANEFATNWQRLAEHFHTLFTTAPSIEALKQTLLQLAVMGKLVPQDPRDEPASELLKRIAEEKERLISEEGLRTTAREDVPKTEHYFTLHAGWASCRLGNLARFIDYRGRTPTKTSSGVPLITAKNVRPAFISREPQEFIADTDYLSWMTRGFPRVGDMLFTTEAPMGNVAIIDIAERFALAQRVICFQLHELGTGPFLKLAMMSSGFQAQLSDAATGMTATGIKSSRLKEIPVPIPPIAEQHRIVAKVDQLMALCDQLKTSLTQARQLNEQLASTLVEQALAEDDQQAPVAPDQKAARTLLAAEATHRLHAQRTFGQRKLQKVIYLAEHAARLATIQGSYLRNVAGPHDRQLMNQAEAELQNNQWYERIERETVGHAYRPLPQAGQHRQAYNSTWSVTERATIEQVIEMMRDWDTDRCEMTVTLYAAWNDFILEGRPVSDEAIVGEVMHSWNDTKLRFGKTQWLAVLAEMKKHKILMPTGFGKRTKGGMLSLPGFE